MRIVVCIKQVLDPATVRVSSRGDLDTREGVRIINPPDQCALEEALRVKDASGAEVVVVTLGEREAEDTLREALAMGADRAILLNDQAFAESDSHAVAYALAQAITTIGAVDLVLLGLHSAGGGGQVGPQLAEMLSLPQITAALSLDVTAGWVAAIQRFEDGDRRTVVSLPAVVTVADQINIPRLAPVASIMNAYSQRMVETWSAVDIGADPSRLGSAGSRTSVRRSFAPEAHARGEILTGTPQEAARALVARLRQRGLI